MAEGFRHVDGAQTIVFGRGALDDARDLIGEGFTLLTTARAERAAPSVVARAASVVHVPAGPVDELAASLLDEVVDGPLVALGGGRVIDVAKAVAAAHGLTGPVAIPTSLSGAEMTGAHRQARGVPAGTPTVRAAVVINDPALSASQPEDELAASSANALGHITTALASSRSTPLARAVASDAAARMTRAWAGDEPDREELALAALLAGSSVDRSGLGPHHALAQTAVRVGGIPHATANAALLPYTIRATRTRTGDVLGADLLTLADRLRDQAGASLSKLTSDAVLLDQAVEAAAARGELAHIPPALTAGEVRDLYLTAT